MDQGRNYPGVWGFRSWIQLAVLVLTLGIGRQFYLLSGRLPEGAPSR
jgi:hypothetical protein